MVETLARYPVPMVFESGDQGGERASAPAHAYRAGPLRQGLLRRRAPLSNGMGRAGGDRQPDRFRLEPAFQVLRQRPDLLRRRVGPARLTLRDRTLRGN